MGSPLGPDRDVDTGRPHARGKVVEPAERGRRGFLRVGDVVLVDVDPEHGQQPAQVRQCLTAGPGEVVQRGAGGVGLRGEDISGQSGLDRDHRHVVGDDVVQFPGNTHTLVDHRPPGPLLLLPLQLLGEPPEFMVAFGEQALSAAQEDGDEGDEQGLACGHDQ
ncbi:hypothetical protein GCM10010278_35590 [Streptomyces melanogenes]|nr:hypothetical protein GCM10010278_35590 [Streptomyces melanogenes]